MRAWSTSALSLGIVDALDDAVDLDAAIERGRRAGPLGIEEVARDRGDHLLGRDHRRPPDDLHLLAGGRPVPCQAPAHDDGVHGAEHGLARGVGGRDPHDARAAEEGLGLGPWHPEDLPTHAGRMQPSWYLQKIQFQHLR